MTTPIPAKPVAKKRTPAKKVAEGKIDHTACYAAKLHPATPAGRSLCRTARAEGKPLTKASLQALAKAKTAAKQQPAKKAAPRNAHETSSEDAMVNLSMQPVPETDDPYDEADAATA